MFLSHAQSYGGAWDLSRAGRVFVAYYSVTGLAAFSATSGNPLLYNGSATGQTKVNAHILGLGFTWTTAPGAAGALGIGIGTTAAPTSTSAVTAVDCTNTSTGAPLSPQCTPYNAGTVTAATGFFLTHQASTGAGSTNPVWTAVDGLISIAPGGFACIGGAGTIATMVARLTLVWAEVPI